MGSGSLTANCWRSELEPDLRIELTGLSACAIHLAAVARLICAVTREHAAVVSAPCSAILIRGALMEDAEAQ